MPEVWCGDVYTTRRTLCKVPRDLTFRTKPQLTAEMLTTLAEEALLPFKYVVAACLYGNSPEFLAAVERYVNLRYLVAHSG